MVCVQLERGKRFGVHSSLRLRFSQERTMMELSDISDLIEAKIQESQSVLLNRLDTLMSSKLGNFQPQWSRRFPSYSTGSSSAIAVSSRGSTATPDIGYQRKPGACFACGKFGHWRNECRELTTEAGDSHKISETYDVLCWQMIAGQVQHPTPVGHLKSNLKKWESMNANKNILSILQYGYKLPLLSLPEKTDIKNNKSARDHSDFVASEIQKLLLTGCIAELNEKPLVVNPLTVASNKDKLRLVLDCRHINAHL